MSQAWQEGTREIEGRADAELDALHVITIHSAKGLEWPVVIPINTTTGVQGTKGILYRRDDETLHMKIAGIEPGSYTDVKAFEEQELERERARLWYVACTRARDLLVLPRHEDPPTGSWAKVLDLHLEDLLPISPKVFKASAPEEAAPAQNQQNQATFVKEDEMIAGSRPEVSWVRPSSIHDDGRDQPEQRVEPPEGVVPAEPVVKPIGNALRGSVLHKLMEEILNGLLEEKSLSISSRADELIRQLGGIPEARAEEGPCSQEMAATILNALSLPVVQEFRTCLKPEISLFSARERDANRVTLISGVADAVVFRDESAIELIIDWKSDVILDQSHRISHIKQMQEYLKAANCSRGAIVYMTAGLVHEVQGGMAHSSHVDDN
jgi:exodeoxyribonuclease-5